MFYKVQTRSVRSTFFRTQKTCLIHGVANNYFRELINNPKKDAHFIRVVDSNGVVHAKRIPPQPLTVEGLRRALKSCTQLQLSIMDLQGKVVAFTGGGFQFV